MAATIEVRGLTVLKQGKPVLRDVSCKILPGQLTGLIDPSGSGKTALMLGALTLRRSSR